MTSADTAVVGTGDGSAPRAGRAARRKYLLDLGLFTAWMITAIPGLTGLPIHEWLGVALIVTLAVHVVMHWDWVVRQLTRLRVRKTNQINRLLDLAMWGLAIMVMVSGLVISEVALPALGVPIAQTTFWMRLHGLSSMLLLVVLASHLLQHLPWIINQTKSLLRVGGAR